MTRIALSEDHGQDVAIEPRKPLTRAERVMLWNRQSGICGPCREATVEPSGPDVIDEHLTALGIGGGNAMRNRALVCRPCAKEKTEIDAGVRAKVNRIRFREAGGKKPGAGRLQGRGFAKFEYPEIPEDAS